MSSKYRHLSQFCYVKIFSTNYDKNLLLLEDPGRVRSQITNVVFQIQRFDFECNLVVNRKVIIRIPAVLGLNPLYIPRYTYPDTAVCYTGLPQLCVHTLCVYTCPAVCTIPRWDTKFSNYMYRLAVCFVTGTWNRHTTAVLHCSTAVVDLY